MPPEPQGARRGPTPEPAPDLFHVRADEPRALTFDQFEQRAAELWQQIPPAYLQGVEGLRVERGARSHPSLDGVYTLGECLTESYPSEWGDPDTIRSFVVLYYGSFWRLSREDETFDWEEELWETLTHELQHHLESLANEDALGEMDYAADENFKRLEGEPFDPQFYRAGEQHAEGCWRVEDEFFLECEARAGVAVFEWNAVRYRVEVTAGSADVVYLNVLAGVADPPRALTLVLQRQLGWLETLRGLLQRRNATVEEHDVSAERA